MIQEVKDGVRHVIFIDTHNSVRKHFVRAKECYSTAKVKLSEKQWAVFAINAYYAAMFLAETELLLLDCEYKDNRFGIIRAYGCLVGNRKNICEFFDVLDELNKLRDSEGYMKSNVPINEMRLRKYLGVIDKWIDYIETNPYYRKKLWLNLL